MTPRITLITLGVDDLEKSLGFYRDGLGLRTEGIVGGEFEHGAVVFFELQAGVKLHSGPARALPMTPVLRSALRARPNSPSGIT